MRLLGNGEVRPIETVRQIDDSVMTLSPDRRAIAEGCEPVVDRHGGYAGAHVGAEPVADRFTLAGTRLDHTQRLLADARFSEAVEIATAEIAALARMTAGDTDLAPILVRALTVEADGLIWLARYDEAEDRCLQAVSLASRVGSGPTAGALLSLARIQLRRGAREQARAALEEVLRLGPRELEQQVRVRALAALAVALLSEEAAPAERLASQALEESTESSRIPALLAAGRVALAAGRVGTARDLAVQALEHARGRRERTALAEALELRAITDRPGPARTGLIEVLQIWESAGAIDDADRVRLQLGRLPRASASDRVAARLAWARLATTGALDVAWFVGPLGDRSVRIMAFGRLEVCVDEAPVPADAWQSRRARDLVRLLVGRRGRAVPRLEICEALWPDEDPDRTLHRLSVLLSIVRGVLGADAVVGDSSCVALCPTRVTVDVEQFLSDVADGVILHDRGSTADSRALLGQAVEEFVDDPFADVPYDDEVTPLRDEARAAHLQALRLLALQCRRVGDHDQAAGYLRRLLSADRYDEDAHRALLEVLISGGRHGQARLAAKHYRAAMAELGVRPRTVSLRPAS